MEEGSSHHEILGVNIDASFEEIEVAWRSKARKLHPDKNNDEGAKSKFQRAQQAYFILGRKAIRDDDIGDKKNRSSQVHETGSLNKLARGESIYLRFISRIPWYRSWGGPKVTLHFEDPLRGVDEELTFHYVWDVSIKFSDGSVASKLWPWARHDDNRVSNRLHRHGQIEFPNGASYFVYVKINRWQTGFSAINIHDKPNDSLPQIRTKWWIP